MSGDVRLEREVISCCLGLMHVGSRQVIRAATRGGLGTAADGSRMLSYVRENLTESGLRDATLDDFVVKNKASHRIVPEILPEGLVVPVEDDDFRRIFAEPDGWERFRTRFPDSDGTLRISRVGFDQNGTQALLYSGQQFDWSIGTSGFWLFMRSPDGWEFRDRAGDSLT